MKKNILIVVMLFAALTVCFANAKPEITVAAPVVKEPVVEKVKEPKIGQIIYLWKLNTFKFANILKIFNYNSEFSNNFNNSFNILISN